MSYIPVKDLKKSRELWARLEKDHELVVTRDGQPRAILVGVEPDEVEETLREIRRARFSAAISRVRRRAAEAPEAEEAVAEAIATSREARR